MSPSTKQGIPSTADVIIPIKTNNSAAFFILSPIFSNIFIPLKR